MVTRCACSQLDLDKMRTCLLVSAQTVSNLVSFSWSTYHHVFHIFVLSVGDFTVSNTLLASAEVPASVPWVRRLCVTFGETFESDELPSFMSYGTVGCELCVSDLQCRLDGVSLHRNTQGSRLIGGPKCGNCRLRTLILYFLWERWFTAVIQCSPWLPTPAVLNLFWHQELVL